MDPNETLKDLRYHLKKLGESTEHDDDVPVLQESAVQVYVLVQALDEWLKKGGALPEEWKR